MIPKLLAALKNHASLNLSGAKRNNSVRDYTVVPSSIRDDTYKASLVTRAIGFAIRANVSLKPSFFKLTSEKGTAICCALFVLTTADARVRKTSS